MAALAVAALLLAGCGTRFPAPTATEAIGRANVVVVSAAGRIATSTPVGAGTPVPPTPTFDPGFGSVLTPLAGSPTPTPALERSPTPVLRATRTPAPSITPLPTIDIPPTATRPPLGVPPTRTPQATRTAPRAPSPTPTRTGTATPVDPQEPEAGNNDLASATTMSTDRDVTAALSGPNDVDVFRFDVLDDSETIQLVVTLTGQDMDLYRLFLITPGRRSSAFGTPVGSVSRHIVYPTRGETGTWFVEVSPTPGKRVPRGSYTLRVETRSLSEPLPIEG